MTARKLGRREGKKSRKFLRPDCVSRWPCGSKDRDLDVLLHVPPFLEANDAVVVGVHLIEELVQFRIADCEAG